MAVWGQKVLEKPPFHQNQMAPSAEDIVDIVRSNFDQSPSDYEMFEGETGLFRSLGRDLAGRCFLKRGDVVVDVGAGTGLSTAVLAKMVCPGGKVIALDNSTAMLDVARRRLVDWGDCIRFVESDAWAQMAEPKSADAVIYNATIFLIPGPDRSLIMAADAVKPGGLVAFNFLKGLHVGLDEIRTLAKREFADDAPYGRPVNNRKDLRHLAMAAGFVEEAYGEVQKPLSWDQAMGFYMVPAMGAGMFPREQGDERKDRVRKLFELVKDRGDIVQRWGWWVGRKPAPREAEPESVPGIARGIA